MNGLILETSTEKGRLILCQEAKPIATQPLPEGPLLSKTLAHLVDSLIKTHSFKPDFIAVGTGPGSYTGIRVGAALAQGLGFGWNIPVLGFCSLKAFIPKNKTSFAVLVDAKMGGFYVLTHLLEKPILIAADKIEAALAQTDFWASPHPQLIQKRAQLQGDWAETEPNIESLAASCYELFLKGDSPPLTLSYLSSP